MNRRIIAENIFLAGVESVLPNRLIVKILSVKDDHLRIGDLDFSLAEFENIYVIGAGKAVALMADEVEKILGSRITGGHIVVKHGHLCKLRYIDVTEAGHPVPDSRGFKATEVILRIADKAKKNDLVICLLSGGGSALLPDFPKGSSPEEIISINGLLVNSGASITEINAVRKHLSGVKGGQLAAAVYPATLVTLILSDVPGDHPDVIASGPTTPDSTTFNQALTVINNFNLTKSLSSGILKHLYQGETGLVSETPKPGDPVFERTHNILIGTNRLALEAAKEKALEYNINAVIIDDQLQGDTSSVAEYIVEISYKFKNDENEVKPVCLLFGGETTVKMTGKGVGGRNQHLALICSTLIEGQHGITVLSGGTDGTDGLTDVAGAVVDSDSYEFAITKNIDPFKYISEFDSYHFFKKVGGHIITGPTMTNVMDIIVVIID
jgi:glycerate 2-kinase